MTITVTDDQGVTQEICPAACYGDLWDPNNMTQVQIEAICNLFQCGPLDVPALANALYLMCQQPSISCGLPVLLLSQPRQTKNSLPYDQVVTIPSGLVPTSAKCSIFRLMFELDTENTQANYNEVLNCELNDQYMGNQQNGGGTVGGDQINIADYFVVNNRSSTDEVRVRLWLGGLTNDPKAFWSLRLYLIGYA